MAANRKRNQSQRFQKWNRKKYVRELAEWIHYFICLKERDYGESKLVQKIAGLLDSAVSYAVLKEVDAGRKKG